MANGECLHLLPAVEVAEEMALLDAEMLRRIKPDEIRDESWMDFNKVKQIQTQPKMASRGCTIDWDWQGETLLYHVLLYAGCMTE